MLSAVQAEPTNYILFHLDGEYRWTRFCFAKGGGKVYLKFNIGKVYSFTANARGTELPSIQNGTLIDP